MSAARVPLIRTLSMSKTVVKSSLQDDGKKDWRKVTPAGRGGEGTAATLAPPQEVAAHPGQKRCLLSQEGSGKFAFIDHRPDLGTLRTIF